MTTREETGLLAARQEELLTCVHCGFCLTDCPTYRVLGEENDSPRGRIHLMRALVEGRLRGDEAVRTHLDRCLGCRACETACPAGVPYGSLLESARAELRERRTGGRGRWERRAASLGYQLLTGPASGITFGLLRLLRGAGIPSLGARVLPGRAGFAAALLAATAPAPTSRPRNGPPRPPTSRADPASGASDPEGRPGSRSAGRPSDREAPDGEVGPRDAARPTFALLEGCVSEGLFGHVHGAVRRVLADGGYREVEAPGQACCGALHAHAGLPERARELAIRNVRAFGESGARWIAVDAAGCGAAMREYPEWVADRPAWRERAARVAARVRDVTELAAESPRPLGGRLEGRAAYDAPCHLLHAQGVRDAPLAALRGVRGLAVEPLPSCDACCGGAGVYNLRQPGLSGRVLEPKVREIRDGGYDWVATGNPGCAMQIGAGLRRAGARIPVVHPLELLDRARGRGKGSDSVKEGAPWI